MVKENKNLSLKDFSEKRKYRASKRRSSNTCYIDNKAVLGGKNL